MKERIAYRLAVYLAVAGLLMFILAPLLARGPQARWSIARSATCSG